jgi:hypothetical protein
MRFLPLSPVAIEKARLVPTAAARFTAPGARLRRAVFLCASALVAACSVGAPTVDEPAALPAAAPLVGSAVGQAKAGDYRFHSALGAKLRFPVLRAGVRVEERHFDPSLPARKFRHSILLTTEAGPAVVIEVWDNPDGADVQAWFDANLAFLVNPAPGVDERSAADKPSVSERPMTRARTMGILVEQPPSDQAPALSFAVFALGDQMVRVSGIDPEGNATARALFERVVDQIESEPAVKR